MHTLLMQCSMTEGNAMRKAIVVTAVLAAVLTIGSTRLMAGEESGAVPAGALFGFSTGGAYHFEGFGAWSVKVAADGKVSIAHDVRGKVKDYGSFQLKEGETKALWALISRAGVGRLASSTRPGVPDEVKWSFTSRDGEKTHAVQIWENDARKAPELRILAAQLGVLVARLTGQKPVGFPPPETEQKPGGKTAQADAPWGQTVDGLACRLVVPAEACIGEAIAATVEIKNVSKETRYLVSIFDIQFPKHAKLDIVGPDGKPLKLSSWGETTPMPGSLQPLGPDEVRRIEFPDLGERFATYDPQARTMQRGFQAAGQYRLAYTFVGMKLPQKMPVGERVVNGQREKVYETIPDEKVQKTWAGTLVSNTATLALRELREDEFAAHEWGVFTVFNDLKYANANRKAEWTSLPEFFYHQFPSVRLKWEPAAWDKPILYFYCTRSTLKVDVRLTFAEGAPVAWWPCCTSPVDQSIARPPKGGETPVFRALHWSAWLGEKVPARTEGPRMRGDPTTQPVKEFDLPAGSWLLDARLKEASLLSVTGSKVQRGRPWSSTQTETERFLYYDGLVPAPNCLRCVKASPDSVTVNNTAAFPIRDLFLVDSRATARDGPALFAHVAGPIAAGEERAVRLLPVPAAEWPMPAAEQLRKALVVAGLTEPEAKAVLRIWDSGFFHAPGVTAFYLLPQSEYDRMLPLEIMPRPKRIVRVGIALHPMFAIEPALGERAERLIAQLDDPDAARRESASKELAQLGPIAWRLLREALKKNPSAQAAKAMNDILNTTDATDWLRQAAKDYNF